MDRFDPPWHPGVYGFGWWPGMLLSVLSIVFWLALFIGLVWLLLKWIIPDLFPMIAGFFGRPVAGHSPLEILRLRYAAGEIDADTFEQMRERLEASYQRDEPRSST
jgi:putative membrane protein